MKKNAFVFAADKNEIFIFAQLLLSLRDFSPLAFSESDIVLYIDDIDTANEDLLRKISPEINFRRLKANRMIPDVVFQRCASFSPFGKSSLLMLELLEKHERVVHLDLNQSIQKELNELFHMKYEIAGVTLAFPAMHMQKALPNDPDAKKHPVLFRTLLCYDSSLLRYGLTEKDWLAAMDHLEKHHAFTMENLISYISMKHQAKFLPLERDVWGAPYFGWRAESKILNYFDVGVDGRPWRNQAAYAAFPAYAHYSRLWTEMGGECPRLADTDTLYNHKDAYSYLNSVQLFLRQLSLTDAGYLSGFRIEFNPWQNKLKLVLEKFKMIYFELKRVKNAQFYNNISLIFNNSYFYSDDTVALFESILSQLRKVCGAFNLVKAQDYLEISISADREQDQRQFFILMIAKSLPKIEKFFGLAGI